MFVCIEKGNEIYTTNQNTYKRTMDQIRAAFRYHITELFPYCFHEDRNVWTEIFKMEIIMNF